VDGRVKPGHDERAPHFFSVRFAPVNRSFTIAH
jgi:hypothetical protein